MCSIVFSEFILDFLIVKISSFQFFEEQWFNLVNKCCYKSSERKKA